MFRLYGHYDNYLCLNNRVYAKFNIRYCLFDILKNADTASKN